jgi:hypothetical protein
MATTKRKLPVLQSEAADDETRPPWHWVVFGALMIFTVWLPLAYAGTALVARSVPRGAEDRSFVAPVLGMVVPLVLAAVAGGFLVGRFGKPAGVREALLSGLLTGLVAIALTALSGPFSPWFLAVLAITTAFAGLGGALGVRLRPA